MEQIQNEEALSALLWNQLKPGVATNAPWRPDAYLHEIQAGCLYAHVWSGGLLLLQQRNGFQRLRFFLQPGGSLPDWRPELPTVLEIASRPQDAALAAAQQAWQRYGFPLLFSRLRMTRPPGGTAVSGSPAFPVRTAGPEDLPQVQALLLACFDVRTGCLPTAWELKEDLPAGRVLLGGSGQAVLHQAPAAGGTELRHLAVSPLLRRQGAAQSLITAYLRQEGHRISRVWVRQDNEAALALYHKNGYRPDSWTSRVYCLD